MEMRSGRPAVVVRFADYLAPFYSGTFREKGAARKVMIFRINAIVVFNLDAVTIAAIALITVTAEPAITVGYEILRNGNYSVHSGDDRLTIGHGEVKPAVRGAAPMGAKTGDNPCISGGRHGAFSLT